MIWGCFVNGSLGNLMNFSKLMNSAKYQYIFNPIPVCFCKEFQAWPKFSTKQ